MRARLVLIGGSGVVGQILVDAFHETRDLLIVDPRAPGRPDIPWISDDAAGCSKAVLRPGDDVAYLATGAAGGWDGLLGSEIEGLRALAQAAAATGVGRFVFASSNHAVGGHERDLMAQGYPRVMPTGDLISEVRPDSEYGAAKAFGEAYLRYLAEQRRLRVSVLRIGTVRSIDDPDVAVRQGEADFLPLSEAERIRRFRATWLYHRDLIRVVEEELDAGVWFRRRFAVSDNPGRFWPLAVEEWDGTVDT
jgi:NAD+ dependent glucose-6-phosphate dehydrogenase